MDNKIIDGEIIAQHPIVHFVCIGGCGLVSDIQRKCATPGCWRARNPLGECDCTDGKHVEFFKIYNPQILEKKPNKVKKT